MLGFNNTQITVTCEARYDVADLDVMFVLDTTGSMAYTASDTNMSGQSINLRAATVIHRLLSTPGKESNARRLQLRAAVLNFYDTLTSSPIHDEHPLRVCTLFLDGECRENHPEQLSRQRHLHLFHFLRAL